MFTALPLNAKMFQFCSDWGPESSGLDTSEKRVSESVARERTAVDRTNRRTEKLYTSQFFLLLIRKQPLEAEKNGYDERMDEFCLKSKPSKM